MKSLKNIIGAILLSSLILKTNCCLRMFNENTCRNDVVCTDDFYGIQWPDLVNEYHPSCNDIAKTVYVQGSSYRGYTVDLVIKSTMNRDLVSVPNNTLDYNENEILAFIHSIDLSNNDLTLAPTIHTMENLEEINLSKNKLKIIKLSNPYELKSLIKLDLSQNLIYELTSESLEYQYKFLKELNFSSNYLVRIPDLEFDEISNLEILDLTNNYLENLNPTTFEGLKKLKILFLSHNRITDINSSLFRFIELENLDLSYNRITHLKGTDFEKLRNVKFLYLHNNFISAIDKEAFNNLDRLSILTLNDNKLITLDKDTFINNIELVTLDLSFNSFRMLPINLFKNNQNIILFSIYGNLLSAALVRGTFEGLANIHKIDLSNQNLTSIEDFAFLGLDKISTLLLNHNKIRSLSKKCFNNLKGLKMLDLSDNEIRTLDFNKDDLIQLQSLSLRNNFLSHITHKQFLGLNRLEFLDISINNISQLESNSFQSLENLITFKISNNPLSGTIVKNTFNGLSSLPTLDISHSLISIIQNGTFNSMLNLKFLNMSHSKLNELQYNCFVQISAVEQIDLSYNSLTAFDVNTTALSNLNILLLNNNLIKIIKTNSFLDLTSITEINIGHNSIETVEVDAFQNQRDLRVLDLSYNEKLKFQGVLLKTTKHLQHFLASGIESNLTFSDISDADITSVNLSDLKVVDVSKLQLQKLVHLNVLILQQNKIDSLKIGDFSNLTDLRNIDLSFNNISFIKPGTFKENTRLEQLNLSHNSLTSLMYGIFRGLNYLTTLDVSNNFINSLESERFYELPSISVLIADHNSITDLDTQEFTGTSLTTLSIGGNPLPCDILVNFNKLYPHIKITAKTLHEGEAENIDGVTCNLKQKNTNLIHDSPTINDNTNILIEIKNILLDISNRNDNIRSYDIPSIQPKELNTTTNNIEESLSKFSNTVAENMNNTANIIANHLNNNELIQRNANNETNIILNRILNVLTLRKTEITTTSTTLRPVVKENLTFQNLLPYLDKINGLENTISEYKASLISNLSDLTNKIFNIESRMQTTTEAPKNSKLTSVNETIPRSFFTEVCVGLILFILVMFILFKVYRSKVFIRKRWSMSTNQLPDAMENSHL